MTKKLARSQIEQKINSYKITKDTRKQIFDFLDDCNEFMINNLDHNLETFISQNYKIQSKHSLTNQIKIEAKSWLTELMLEVYASNKNVSTWYIELYLERGKINSSYKKEKKV